jgi:carbonic anhydrase
MDAHERQPPVTADEALARLVAGNERFRRGQSHWAGIRPESLAELAKAQEPYATVLGCSDSRVPPELLFDVGVGDLFVIRVAGNVTSREVFGSLQYAASHLQTQLFVVLGHEGCGAVAAALDTNLRGTRHRSRIQILADSILPALGDLDRRLAYDAQLALAVERNVRWSMNQIAESAEGRTRLAEGRMKLVGGVYEIGSGHVRFLRDETV